MVLRQDRRIEGWKIWIAILGYIITGGVQYGIFTERMTNIETSIQDIKSDIHELRGQVIDDIRKNK
jgi:hypothetical protein